MQAKRNKFTLQFSARLLQFGKGAGIRIMVERISASDEFMITR